MAERTKVFISYSHDSPEHAQRVLDLADALRHGGLEVILDQYVHPAPDEGWPLWMETRLDEANFVLMVCTEIYRRRVMRQEQAGTGLGVRWEGSLIYNRIYNDKSSGSRFIPVLFEGGEPAHIPNPVQGHTYYRISVFDVSRDAGFEGLYRHLTGQAPTPPREIGAVQTLSPHLRWVPPDPRNRSRMLEKVRKIWITGGVFLSYRRDDSHDITDRIYDWLIRARGRRNIFKDVDAIPLGRNFHQVIRDAVGRCDILLAVIGPGWLTAAKVPGMRRIDDPDDFVRMEIETALERDIPIVPLLVNNATMPTAEDLPPSLRPLAYRNGMPVRPDPDFRRDMERLIAALKTRSPLPRWLPVRRWLLGAAVVAALTLLLAILAMTSGRVPFVRQRAVTNPPDGPAGTSPIEAEKAGPKIIANNQVSNGRQTSDLPAPAPASGDQNQRIPPPPKTSAKLS